MVASFHGSMKLLKGNGRSLGSQRILYEPDTGDPTLPNVRWQERYRSGSDGWRDLEIDNPGTGGEPTDVLAVMESAEGQDATLAALATEDGGQAVAATVVPVLGVDGETPLPLSTMLGPDVRPEQFGAIGDGVLRPVSDWLASRGYADLAAIQADYPDVTALTDSIDWAALKKAERVATLGAVLLTGASVYALNRPLVFGTHATGARHLLSRGGMATLAFQSFATVADCLTLQAYNYGQPNPTAPQNIPVFVDWVTVDGGNTTATANNQRDGIRLNGLDRARLGVAGIRNTGRHGLAIIPDDYGWVENFATDFLYIQDVGYHGICIDLAALAVFFNESRLHYEIRGVARRYTGGVGVYWRAGNAWGGTKCSGIVMQQCNMDALRAGSVANGKDIGGNPHFFDYTVGGMNLFKAIKLLGGGWETTDGGALVSSPDLVGFDSSLTAANFQVCECVGVDPGGWSEGLLNKAAGLGWYCEEAAYNRRYGGVIHHLNSPAGVLSLVGTSYASLQRAAGAATGVTLDIPLHPKWVTVNDHGVLLRVALSYQKYPGSGEAWRGTVEVAKSLAGDGTFWVMGKTDTSDVGANITAPAVSLVGTAPPTHLRLTFDTTAAFAGGGGADRIRGYVSLAGGSHDRAW